MLTSGSASTILPLRPLPFHSANPTLLRSTTALRPNQVSGHTRFKVERQGESGEYKITRQVVYRTFADWELRLP